MKKAAQFLFCLPIVLSLAQACTGYSYNIFGSVSGTVTDYSSGSPLENAIITLIPGSASTQSSIDGKFSFENLDEGQYTISVQKDGYYANRKNINVRSDENTDITISLNKIPEYERQ